MTCTVTLEVCGQLFPVHSETIENGPCSRLTTLHKIGWAQNKSERISVNRPAESFAAILAFYQTGELHIPMTSCPGAFLNELEFWEISPENLSGCCYHRLQSFLEEQDTVRIFKDKQKNSGLTVSSLKSMNCFQKLRAKTWEIIDYTRPTVTGKLYLLLTLIMVLASIFTLALSTDPIFRRTMTNCERLEYMVSTGAEGFEIMRPYFQELCEETDVPEFSPELVNKLNRSELFRLIRDKNGSQDKEFLTFKFLIPRISKSPSGLKKSVTPGPSKEVRDFILIEPSNSSTGNTSDNNVDISQRVAPPSLIANAMSNIFISDTEYVTVPNLKKKIFSLAILEAATTIFFSIELILRLSSCPKLKVYFLSIINCSDAVSLIGAYLYFIMYIINPSLRYGGWIDYLAYLQMLRSLRLFRVVLNIRAGKVLIHSLRENIKDLCILIFFLFAGMCTFASCIYIVEENPNIQSIPDAWYLSIITMTTVGYGDIHPQTKIGRLICCLCAVAGVLLLALTVPIFANHFLVLYNHAESENVIEKYLKEKKERQKQKRLNTDKKEEMCETQSV